MNRYLKREINDLDDVRMAMKYLSEIREKEYESCHYPIRVFAIT